MQKAWALYAALYRLTGNNPVITSGIRKPAEKYSLHEDGYAIDCRCRDVPSEIASQIVLTLRKVLGNDYDVIHYCKTGHIHIEYQRYLDDKADWEMDEEVVEVD